MSNPCSPGPLAPRADPATLARTTIMRTVVRTSRSSLWKALIIVAVVSAGCGRVTLLLGGGPPYRGYHHDDFYYDSDPYTYYDGYWYYDDYWYDDYDDYYFVDYVDGWYYDWYGGCYYCKSSNDLDSTSLEQPASWDDQWGPWERFVQARVDFLLTERVPDSRIARLPPGE